MPGAIWSAKRYQLPKYNYKSLVSEIQSWVKQRQGRVKHSHEPKLWSNNMADMFHIEGSGMVPLWLAPKGEGYSNLQILYEDSLLYVYAHKGDLPEIFQDVHESVIMPYVKRYGGVPLDEMPHLLDMDLRPWLKRNFGLETVHGAFIRSLKEGNTNASLLLTSQSKTGPNVANLRLDTGVESVKTSSEEVSIPRGVTIKVKRSRTIEHTVDIDWHKSSGVNIDTGFKPIISASIRGEIGQSQGRSYHESETLEYEVSLSGEISTRYRLTWEDVWRKGVAEFQIGNTTQAIPFRFREWTKLEVEPIR